MVSWADAHRIGHATALRTHQELGLSPSERVQVIEAADALGICTLFGPLPRLAGVYVREPLGPPGVQVNTRLPMSKQRYTLAHEIGHHVLGHSSTVDLDTDLMPGAGKVPDHEKTAEAFAAWFLMPRQLIKALVGEKSLSGPADIYQLSLRLGTSFEATCRQLENLRYLTPTQRARHLRVRPQDIKVALTGQPPVGVGRSDVHVVDRSIAGRVVYALSSDLLIVRSDVAAPRRFTVEVGRLAVPEDSGPVGDLQGPVFRYRTVDLAPANPGHRAPATEVRVAVNGVEWSFSLVVEPPRKGVAERWF